MILARSVQKQCRFAGGFGRENVCPYIQIAPEGCFWAREDGFKGKDCYNSVITNFRAIRKTAFQVKQKETPGSVKNCRAFLYLANRSYRLTIKPKYSLVNNKTNPDCSSEFALLSSGDPYGNRTHVFAVRGRCLSLLTNGPFLRSNRYYNIPYMKKQPLFEKTFSGKIPPAAFVAGGTCDRSVGRSLLGASRRSGTLTSREPASRRSRRRRR